MNQLYGSQPVKVIELLNQRRRIGYRPGDSDGNRIGLIVEGGSMRGAISSAALGALSQLGYRSCFDEVWGTSSGAINAAYFVSGQTNLGTTIYYEIATDPAFINIWRWPNAMDIDRLFDNLLAAGKLMDIDAIMHSGTDLYISATDVDTGSAVYFSNRDNRPEIIIPALRASACAPMFTNRTEGIDLNFYNDGMAQAALPVAAAAMRCTHLVAALTRKIGYRKQRSAILGFVEAMRLRAYSREYRRSYRSRHVLYNRALDTLFDGRASPCSLVIAPGPRDDLIGKSETRTRSLTQAIGQSRDRVEAIFAA
jgi:predicted patatin/cPLA2 family phospholipase